ncbi:Toll-like receptor 4 [Mytilus coruscus]|uniref:Toll-like receptor 4 n=1 Tax=Mytilus coruscus TaxID=42192 RepID=A0A6J8DAJ6_MYTCO|nr:Toll-like receptor 4 [Mytilus coruscus]
MGAYLNYININITCKHKLCDRIAEDKTISYLKSLEKLEIDVPAIYQKRNIFGEGYKYLNHLSSLNVGTCDELLINAKFFEYMPLLTYLSFDIRCKIHITPGGHRSLKNIKQFYVHRLVDTLLPYLNNFTNELKLTPIKTLSFRNTFAEGFEDRYYPWNPISRNLHNSSLKQLQMTANKLGESFPVSKLDSPPASLQALNLSSNKLEKFALDLGNIRNLSLQNNYLGGFLSTRSYKMSNESSSLEFIDLSANSIETLTFILFKDQPNLKCINLSHNKLQKITFDVSRLNDLHYLDLSRNNFTTLDEKAMAMLDGLSKNTFFTVNLRNNALQCTCNTLTFLKWISKTKVELLLNDKCTLEDGTIVSLNPIDSIIQQLQKECKNEGNAKLCVHQRDFLPGQQITFNITNAIHDSRKTVCIITRKFLESYYCMFEFNMARMENIYSRDGRNIIFLVFLEQIQPREMPLMMLELIEKQSYIEYPNEEEGNIVFWGKIKEAIHS